MSERQERDQLRVGSDAIRGRRDESLRGGRDVGRRLGISHGLPMLHYSAMDARSERVTIRELGHVALFVRDLDATRRFYRDTLGLAETGTGKGGRIVFFSAGVHHHDLSCELARAEGPGPQPKGLPRPHGEREPTPDRAERRPREEVRGAIARPRADGY